MTAPTVQAQPIILNTRPLPMGATLEDAFKQQKLHSLPFPTIVNKALTLKQVAAYSEQPLDVVLEDLKQSLLQSQTFWIFISKSSVQFFQQFIQNIQAEGETFEFSPQGHVIAVGETTKTELTTINPKLNVFTPTQAHAEALIAMPEFYACQQVILVKGVGGRGLIAEHFRQQQKPVIELNLYQRTPQVYEQTEIESWPSADIVLATSVDIAKATLTNINQLAEPLRQEFLQTKAWVVLSDRIKQFLIAQSVAKQNIFVCEHSDNSSIIKMIKHIGKASS